MPMMLMSILKIILHTHTHKHTHTRVERTVWNP